MLNWDSIIDESDLASVLPDEYVHFARPIRDGLILFLEGLPRDRQIAILAEQGTLPLETGISRRLAVLARSCPVLQKLGQIVARDQRLAVELRVQLQQLESLPPSVPQETIQAILTEQLGPLDDLGVTLMPPALAEASVAVVVPFRCHRQSPPRDGVFKVLKPGIGDRMEHELGLLHQVGSYLDQRCDELRIPHLDYRESFEQVRDKLHFEIRLDSEQEHLRQARDFYSQEPRVQVPEVLDYCTSQVTAMERVWGRRVTEHQLRSQSERLRLAELVVEALIAQPIFSRTSQALFHSDPHAGNLFLTDDDRLAILDWSLVGTLGERERLAIVQIMLAAVSLRSERIVDILTDLAQRRLVDHATLTQVVRSWLRRIRHGQFPGIRWLIGMLDEAVQTAQLRVSADMMLFRKTLHTLEGVLADIEADQFQIDGVLFREFLRRFALEWPQRWVSWPHSRQFATRLSNVDLTQAILNLPWTASRLWVDNSLDLWEWSTQRARAGGLAATNVSPENKE